MIENRRPLTEAELQQAKINMLIVSVDTLTRQLTEHNVFQVIAEQEAVIRDAKFETFREELKAHSKATDELASLLSPIKWTLKIFGFIGKWIRYAMSGLSTTIKWAGAIAAACLAIYSLYYMATHEGTLPTLPKIK